MACACLSWHLVWCCEWCEHYSRWCSTFHNNLIPLKPEFICFFVLMYSGNDLPYLQQTPNQPSPTFLPPRRPLRHPMNTHLHGFFISRALVTKLNKPVHNTSTTGTNANSTTMPPHYHHDDPLGTLWTHVCRVFLFFRALAANWHSIHSWQVWGLI